MSETNESQLFKVRQDYLCVLNRWTSAVAANSSQQPWKRQRWVPEPTFTATIKPWPAAEPTFTASLQPCPATGPNLHSHLLIPSPHCPACESHTKQHRYIQSKWTFLYTYILSTNLQFKSLTCNTEAARNIRPFDADRGREEDFDRWGISCTQQTTTHQNRGESPQTGAQENKKQGITSDHILLISIQSDPPLIWYLCIYLYMLK